MALKVFTAGTSAKASEVNENFEEVKLGSSPIGTVQAWLKSYTNTPTLPSNWVECNGQTLSDAESVYNGQTIPNLNGPVETGLKGRFLRGHTSSGETESSQNLLHSHTYTVSNPNTGRASGGNPSQDQNGASNTGENGGAEARPHNYSVVWIMRIK